MKVLPETSLESPHNEYNMVSSILAVLPPNPSDNGVVVYVLVLMMIVLVFTGTGLAGWFYVIVCLMVLRAYI
jgi:hypothetical protein